MPSNNDLKESENHKMPYCAALFPDDYLPKNMTEGKFYPTLGKNSRYSEEVVSFKVRRYKVKFFNYASRVTEFSVYILND